MEKQEEKKRTPEEKEYIDNMLLQLEKLEKATFYGYKSEEFKQATADFKELQKTKPTSLKE